MIAQRARSHPEVSLRRDLDGEADHVGKDFADTTDATYNPEISESGTTSTSRVDADSPEKGFKGLSERLGDIKKNKKNHKNSNSSDEDDASTLYDKSDLY